MFYYYAFLLVAVVGFLVLCVVIKDKADEIIYGLRNIRKEMEKDREARQ